MTTLAPSFLNGSSSFVGNKNFHKNLNEFDFPPHPSTSYRVSDHSSNFIFHLIFFIPVGYQDIHKSMDEFKFRSDPITDYRVSCP